MIEGGPPADMLDIPVGDPGFEKFRRGVVSGLDMALAITTRRHPNETPL
jgi:hypothetical protein